MKVLPKWYILLLDNLSGGFRTADILDSLDIKEKLTPRDCLALEVLALQVCQASSPQILEVGSWKGHSTSILGKVAKQYKGKVFAVDHWRGNKGTWNTEMINTQDIYSIFKHNMEVLGLQNTVEAVRMESHKASNLFSNSSLELIFLDGDHTYKGFKQDVNDWIPKLKSNGIICGHDCEGYFSEYSLIRKIWIVTHLNTDYRFCHPGIVFALYRKFDKNFRRYDNSSIWSREK